MYTSQADAVKDQFLAYKREEQEIAKLKDQKAMVQSQMTGIRAQELSDMPRSPSVSNDKMTEYVVRVEALDAQIRWRERRQATCRASLMRLVGLLKRPEERAIIRCRYLKGMEWSEVLKSVYQNEPEFQKKQDAYRRKMFRQHDGALKEMAKKWTVNNGGES